MRRCALESGASLVPAIWRCMRGRAPIKDLHARSAAAPRRALGTESALKNGSSSRLGGLVVPSSSAPGFRVIYRACNYDSGVWARVMEAALRAGDRRAP